jgi:hypothetical protein
MFMNSPSVHFALCNVHTISRSLHKGILLSASLNTMHILLGCGFWVGFFFADEAVSRLRRHVRENRGLIGHAHFPDFCEQELGDFFTLS